MGAVATERRRISTSGTPSSPSCFRAYGADSLRRCARGTRCAWTSLRVGSRAGMAGEAERSLADVIVGVDRVVVADGPSYDPRHRKANRILADVRDAGAIEELVLALAVGPPTPAAWMTPGAMNCVFLWDRRV